MIPTTRRRLQVACLCVVMLLVGMNTYRKATTLPSTLYEHAFNSSYFGADIARVQVNLTDRYSSHERTNVHPLFSLFVALPCLIGQKLLGLQPITAVSLALAVNASVMAGFMSYLLFYITKRLVDTAAFLLLFLSSLSSLVWSSVPETFPFGATSILFPLVILTIPAARKYDSTQVVSNVVAVSVTVTNWMSGLLSCVLTVSFRKTLRVVTNTIVMVAALWSVQKYVYPSSGHFMEVADERQYISTGVSLTVVRYFFLDSLAAASLEAGYRPNNDPLRVSIQPQKPVVSLGRNVRDGDRWRVTVVWGLWLMLLLCGLTGGVRCKGDDPLGVAILGVVGWQLGIHSVYSVGETFLYSLHWMPLLVLLASFSSRSRLRLLALGVVLLIVVLIGVSNTLLADESLSIARRFELDQVDLIHRR